MQKYRLAYLQKEMNKIKLLQHQHKLVEVEEKITLPKDEEERGTEVQ